MENFHGQPLDIRLGAYLDGELDPAETAAIEALLAADPEARDLLAAMKSGSALGAQAFDAMLREPAPLHLARAIKQHANRQSAPQRPALQFAQNWVKPDWLRFAPRAVAASAILLLAGGYSGFLIGQYRGETIISDSGGVTTAPVVVEPEAKTRSFTFGQKASTPGLPVFNADDLAQIHSVYSRERSRAAEIPAADADMLRTWLSKSASVAFAIPDLLGEGLVFEGGRLVALDGAPAIALFYSNERRDMFAIYYARGAAEATTITVGKTAVRAGVKGKVAWFVAGPTDTDLLDQIAKEAQGAI